MCALLRAPGLWEGLLWARAGAGVCHEGLFTPVFAVTQPRSQPPMSRGRPRPMAVWKCFRLDWVCLQRGDGDLLLELLLGRA